MTERPKRQGKPNNDEAVQTTAQCERLSEPNNGAIHSNILLSTTDQYKRQGDPIIQTQERSKQRQSDPNDGAIQTTERSKQGCDPNDGAQRVIQMTGRSKLQGDPNDGAIQTQSIDGS